VMDSMYLDGLEDAYEPGKLMGAFAEETAAAYQFTRADMDAYAVESHKRLANAQTQGWLKGEVVGRHLSELVVPEQHRQAHEAGLERFRATPVPSLHIGAVRDAHARGLQLVAQRVQHAQRQHELRARVETGLRRRGNLVAADLQAGVRDDDAAPVFKRLPEFPAAARFEDTVHARGA